MDRDGVINQEVGYLHNSKDFKFIDGTFDACKKFQTLGYKLIIVTNQSGIARGYYKEEDFHVLNNWMLAQFANKDIGGPYWIKDAPKAYKDFNPVEFVNNWNTPIMIIQGGLDFRVGIEQGLAAFQTAQLKGIKSKLLYLPEENHWVLSAQNGVVWQREFFDWLKQSNKDRRKLN